MNTTAINSQTTIGILAAMPEELAQIRVALKNSKEFQIQGRKIFQGKIGNFDIVSTLTGIGKINAAMSTQFLFDQFNIKVLLVMGVAGRLSDNYHIGDIVFVTQTFQHDYGFLGESGFTINAIGQVPQIGIGSLDEPFTQDLSINWTVKNDKNDFFPLIHSAAMAFKDQLQPISINSINYFPNIKQGISATGDQFISQKAKQQELRALGADIANMEDSAVAYVAQYHQVPIIIIRAISDGSDGLATADFGNFLKTVADNNAHLLVHLLHRKDMATYLANL